VQTGQSKALMLFETCPKQ